MQKWKTRSRKEVLKFNDNLKIESHILELPDGRIIKDWPWIIARDFVTLLAITDEGNFVCFRQSKYGLDGVSLAPIGGYVEDSESPLEAAQRELLEETGHVASEWIDLGKYRVDPNCGISMGFLFLANNAHSIALPSSDDLEEQEIVLLNRAELEKALDQGDFKVFAWVALVALVLKYLERNTSA